MFAALFVLYVTIEPDVSPGRLGLIIAAGAVGGLLGAAVTGPVTSQPQMPQRRPTDSSAPSWHRASA